MGDSPARGTSDGACSANFSASLLNYHLLDPERAGEGEDETDYGVPSLLDLIKSPAISKESLEEALRISEDDVNERRPSDRGLHGDVAVLHRLVTGKYTHRTELVTTLMIFSDADINLPTSKGKTAFHLAVEFGNVELMRNLAALGADVNLPDHNQYTPLTTAQMKARDHLAQKETPPKLHVYPLTDSDSDISFFNTGYHTGRLDAHGHSTSFCGGKESRRGDSPIMAGLREVGALSKEEYFAAKSCSRKRVCEENRKATCLAKVDSPQTRKTSLKSSAVPSSLSSKSLYVQLDSELAAFLSTPGQEVSPEQAVDIVKRLQTSVVQRQRGGARVLCLDGGGVRGLVQLEILRQLEERMGGEPVTKLFDYIVGTSTGGIIALALVYGGRTVRQLQQLYLQMKKDVFAKQSLFELGNTAKLEEYLKLWLGTDKRMNKESHPKVLVTAVKRKDTHLKIRMFNNFLGDKYSKALVWEVARYTSAAPFYFKPKNDYVDGGLLANSPSLQALTTIQAHLRHQEGGGGGGGGGVSLVVSVGAGVNPAHEYGNLEITNAIDYLFRNVQFLRFMGDVVASHSVMSEASCEGACVEQGIHYVRLSPALRSEVDPGEIDNQRLLDMLWTTRTYLHSSTHLLDSIRQFFSN